MNWKVIGVVFLCVLVFLIGFFLGGFRWEWAQEKHSSDVALWSMLGGWVSGLATLSAVIVSMWMAYQASQAGLEKLDLIVKPLISINGLGDKTNSQIVVKSVRAVTTPIIRVLIQIDGVNDVVDITAVNENSINLPYTLHQLGEKYEFKFDLFLSIGWSSALIELSQNGEPTFKKGCFIIETAMKQHRVRIPTEILERLNSLYKKEKEYKAKQHL